jgi:hypothetical protein
MASGIRMDLDWVGTDSGADRAQSNADAAPIAAPNGATAGRYLTDEEILGIDAPSPDSGYGGHARLGGDTRQSVIPTEARNLSSIEDGSKDIAQGESSGESRPRNDKRVEQGVRSSERAAESAGAGTPPMPEWMQVAAADPQHGAEAQQLWREHQEFRAAFASPEEARAMKELLPGGVRDVLSLREATQSVERIDAALFSGDARAQSEVVAELARANPAAFRSLFAEAAKVLAGLQARSREASNYDGSDGKGLSAGPTLRSSSGQALRETSEGWGTRNSEAGGQRLEAGNPGGHQSPRANHESPFATAQGKPVTGHGPQATGHDFDPAAYSAFERSTNDVVARDVRGSIGDTLARVLPEGVADGAARRIGEDIFQEIHRALASDRTLSEQVAAVLRERRFGSPEQQQIASLVAGRARQLVPSVARRVIGEWTSSVLNTSRSKAARQAAAASRVDIAAPGGSLDSMPLRSGAAGSRRGVDYSSMTDEQILGI